MPTGKTKDAGWQIGVTTTLDHPLADVWELLTDPGGVAIWLGNDVTLAGKKGETYETDEGTTGEIRSYHPEDRIRLTWQPHDWDHVTTVQLAIRANGDRTKLTLHQERLANADEREQQRTHWKTVASNLADALDERFS
jgi:uncharacterized protein YndB with AHSA1/START domain